MIGLLIGMFATLAVTQVLLNSEGQSRATAAGTDSQVNGALALSTLQRELMPAGYGFSSMPASIGCPLAAAFNGAAIAGFPTNLVPLTITQGASGAPDTIRMLGSGKSSYSVPLRIVTPGYNPAAAPTSFGFPVSTVRTVEGPKIDGAGNFVSPGDLMVAVIDSTTPCEVFRVSANPGSNPVVDRTDDLRWNAAGFPAGTYPQGSALINMGAFIDRTYSVGTATSSLQVRSLRLAPDSTPSYVGPDELFPGIVNMKALYGKDTNADGVVDAWDNTTPTTNAGWLQVLALRVAVVARSAQFEKEDVTSTNPLWDVGTAVPTTGSSTCGSSKCVPIKIDFGYASDWRRYRYKVFDTVIPLRNMLWTS
jgi:type IV pilus assembly protein PilW